ncbi:MAG: hypothetical protein ACXADB_04005 [Candidatus Hermodarchaeia archaeon]|jgi:cobalamin biosynthesis protein CobD/CbiB
MIVLGYLIFIWALAQTSWMLIVKLNRTLNPKPVYIRYYELPLCISWKSIARYINAIKERQRRWRLQAERDIIEAASRRALEDIQAAEDAEVFAALNSAADGLE